MLGPYVPRGGYKVVYPPPEKQNNCPIPPEILPAYEINVNFLISSNGNLGQNIPPPPQTVKPVGTYGLFGRIW